VKLVIAWRPIRALFFFFSVYFRAEPHLCPFDNAICDPLRRSSSFYAHAKHLETPYPVSALHSCSSAPELIRPHSIVQPFSNSLLASIYTNQFQSNSATLLECAVLPSIQQFSNSLLASIDLLTNSSPILQFRSNVLIYGPVFFSLPFVCLRRGCLMPDSLSKSAFIVAPSLPSIDISSSAVKFAADQYFLQSVFPSVLAQLSASNLGPLTALFKANFPASTVELPLRSTSILGAVGALRKSHH
jgi:hypothetical protein